MTTAEEIKAKMKAAGKEHAFEFHIEIENINKALEGIRTLQELRIEMLKHNPYFALVIHLALRDIRPILVGLAGGMMEDIQKAEDELKKEEGK